MTLMKNNRLLRILLVKKLFLISILMLSKISFADEIEDYNVQNDDNKIIIS